MSVSKIVECDNTIIFNKKNGCTIISAKDEIIAQCKAENGVYKFSGIPYKKNCLLAKTKQTALMWHRRLGHINYQSLKKMRDGAVLGIEFDDDDSEIKKCETCPLGKHTRMPFKSSERKSNKILELIHLDLMGPMETQSIGHAKYALTMVDDFSREVFIYFIKSKAEVLTIFTKFKSFVENQTGEKIKTIRTDNGGEYVSNDFEKFCEKNGIQHQKTVAYTPQQNGVAERMNRTIVEKAKCLLFDAELPKSYWAEASNMSVYLINRSFSTSHGKIPDELFFNKKVDISGLRLFGCPVMVHVNKEKRKKWDKNSNKMIFVGYDSDVKGYRCIDRETRRLTISRDVIFYEPIQKSTISLSDDELLDGTINDTSLNPPINSTPINSNIQATINEATNLDESTLTDDFQSSNEIEEEDITTV